MLSKENKKIISNAKKVTFQKLEKFGIKDKFMIRVRESKEDWVAQYRCNSQFGSRGPIFWISPCLLKHKDELIISMLHEYGHVIAEWAWSRSPKMGKILRKHWPGKDSFLQRDWAEEDFAEDFAYYVYGYSMRASSLIDNKGMNKIIKAYCSDISFYKEYNSMLNFINTP